MKYHPPKINNKECYVPIVVKNKDYLIGYLHSMNLFTELLEVSLEKMGVMIETSDFEMCLDSSRFNDIMSNGKRRSKCSKDEVVNFIKESFNKKILKIKEPHPDNQSEIFNDCLLKIECPCGLGIYTFNRVEDIPDKTLKCSVCGQIILDYTNHYDIDFEFDGDDSLPEGENYDN